MYMCFIIYWFYFIQTTCKYLETRGEQLLREIIKTNDFSKLYTSLTDAHKADLEVPSKAHNILELWSQGLTQHLASTLAV